MKAYEANIACKDMRPGMIFMYDDEIQMIIQVKKINVDDIELVILTSSQRRQSHINGPLICDESEMYYAFWEQVA